MLEMSSFSQSSPEKYPLIENLEAAQDNTSSMFQQLLRSSDSSAGLMAALSDDDINMAKRLKSDESISDFMQSIGKSADMFQHAFRSSDSAAMIAEILQSRSRAKPDGIEQHSKKMDAGSLMMTQFSDMLTSKEWLPHDAAKHIDNSSIQSVFFRSATSSTQKSTDWNQMFESQLPPSLTHASPEKKEVPSFLAVEELIEEDDDGKPAASTPKKKRRKRNRTKPNHDPEVMDYCEVTDDDVLLGRGGRSNHHAGNKRYLIEKEKIQPRYLAADKDEKTGISQELVDIVEKWGGRFLKLDDETNRWYKVKNIVARKKASQTLREMNTEQYRASKRAKYGC